MKVQELFAKVGGVANPFFIIIKALTMHYFRFKYIFFIKKNSIEFVNEYKNNKPIKLIEEKVNLETENFTQFRKISSNYLSETPKDKNSLGSNVDFLENEKKMTFSTKESKPSSPSLPMKNLLKNELSQILLKMIALRNILQQMKNAIILI